MTQTKDIKRERKQKIERLLTKPMSCYEVVQITGYPSPSVHTYMEELHAEERTHIAEWRVGVRSMTKLYLAGPGEDAPKPERFKIDKEAEEELFKRPPTVVKVQRDPLVAAFFGEAAVQAA